MKKLICFILAFVGSTGLAAQTLDDLVFLTENYAPLNFEEDGALKGIAVEALVEMFNMVDTTKTIKDIQLWPWARSYKTVLNKKNTVLFSMARSEAREKLFKWVGPIAPSHVVIIAKKSRGIKIGSVEDINKYETGVVRDDIGEQLLLELGVSKEGIRQTNSGTSTAKMLHKDRIDIWAYEGMVAFWNIRTIGGNPKDYEVVYSLKRSNYFYSFHKDTDDRIVAEIQNALDKLISSGKLQKIAKKYIDY